MCINIRVYYNRASVNRSRRTSGAGLFERERGKSRLTANKAASGALRDQVARSAFAYCAGAIGRLGAAFDPSWISPGHVFTVAVSGRAKNNMCRDFTSTWRFINESLNKHLLSPGN